MKPLAFDDIARLPIVEYYERAFRKATGVSLKLVPPEPTGLPRKAGFSENDFCTLVAGSPVGCSSCQETEGRAQHNAARKLSTQQLYCYAGLTVVAAPVLVDGRHVATLLSGQVFRREPTERDFLMIMKFLDNGLGEAWVRKTRRAYFDTPVLNAERFQAAIQLLEVFAGYLAEVAARQANATNETEPDSISRAKQFVQSHAAEPITLDQVVQHVHVSRFYFCKLFKKATGLTLTEYVARVRVEKAKSLLGDPTKRISEVVFDAGFGSIPHFNSVFKNHVGMAPTEYRAKLRSENET